jgi:oxidase EvaA
MTSAPALRHVQQTGFLRSALTHEGLISPPLFRAWLAECSRQASMTVKQIPFSALREWDLSGVPLRIRHSSGKFFTIEGIEVETDFGPVPRWQQPIICQPEVGILGFITREFDGVRHFLTQAKAEPGNVNMVQLAPTVQATRSNYLRVHGGASQPFLEYFSDPSRGRVLVDQVQTEQASRFMQKRNRNMIVEVGEHISIPDNFLWLTLGQLKRLLREDNLLNMDARSVLSCVSLELREERDERRTDGTSRFGRELLRSLDEDRPPLHSDLAILQWLSALRSTYTMKLTRVPLDRLDQWSSSDWEIRHTSGRYFSVIAVEVEARRREVRSWSQPMLAHSDEGLNGFLMQMIDGMLHFLVRACVYPGNREMFELGPTVSRSNAAREAGRPDAPPLLSLFLSPPPGSVRYEALQSEEGGRFYHYQNRYMLLEIPPNERISVPSSSCWMTLRQIRDLLRHGYFTIEARNILACLDVASN